MHTQLLNMYFAFKAQKCNVSYYTINTWPTVYRVQQSNSQVVSCMLYRTEMASSNRLMNRHTLTQTQNWQCTKVVLSPGPLHTAKTGKKNHSCSKLHIPRQLYLGYSLVPRPATFSIARRKAFV